MLSHAEVRFAGGGEPGIAQTLDGLAGQEAGAHRALPLGAMPVAREIERGGPGIAEVREEERAGSGGRPLSLGPQRQLPLPREAPGPRAPTVTGPPPRAAHIGPNARRARGRDEALADGFALAPTPKSAPGPAGV